MSGGPRPILAVRLLGPADAVTRQQAYPASYYTETLRDRTVTFRTSARPVMKTGKIRVYLTTVPNEAPSR